MYDIEFVKSADKDFQKLPKDVQERVKASLERARIRPEAHFERMVGEPVYKLRVGDYRVIADIIHGKLLILVIEIGNRKNVYASFARKKQS